MLASKITLLQIQLWFVVKKIWNTSNKDKRTYKINETKMFSTNHIILAYIKEFIN